MPLSKEKTVVETTVMPDGRIRLTEETNILEDGVILSGRKDYRFIDVGDDVSAEDTLVKDIVNGNLHTPARISARKAAKAPDVAVPVA